MRAIDADSLNNYKFGENLMASSYADGWDDAIDAIMKDAPTVEERPQGYWGKWIISEVQCPNCFEYFEIDCYSEGELNKCPNCRAQMKKEEST